MPEPLLPAAPALSMLDVSSVMRPFVCTLLLVVGGDSFADGMRAYRAGRFAEAVAAFAAAVQELGPSAPPALHYDHALAAVCASDLAAAEAALSKIPSDAGRDLVQRRDFLRGNLAHARSATAAQQAGRVEAEPFAFDAAIALAEAARDAWQGVAMAEPTWHHARRNAERAVLWLEELQRRRAAAEAKKPKKEPDAPKPRPQELPPPAEPPQELSPAQLRRLLDKLALKEKEKARLRRSRQQAVSGEAQNDW